MTTANTAGMKKKTDVKVSLFHGIFPYFLIFRPDIFWRFHFQPTALIIFYDMFELERSALESCGGFLFSEKLWPCRGYNFTFFFFPSRSKIFFFLLPPLSLFYFFDVINFFLTNDHFYVVGYSHVRQEHKNLLKISAIHVYSYITY